MTNGIDFKQGHGLLPCIIPVEKECFSDAWNEAMLSAEFAKTNNRSFGLFIEGKLVSYCLINISFDEAELLRIATLPAFRKSGLANMLLDHALQNIATEGCHRILLEVHEHNTAAIRMYNNAGFNVISHRKNYYSDGASAIIMQKDLS